MSRVTTVLLAALVLLFAYLVLAWFVDGYFGGTIFPDDLERDSWDPPSTWADWRDVIIVLTGIFWLIGAILFAAVAGALFFLIMMLRRILRDNVAPAVDSLKVSLDNVKGTTEFAGETVVSPLIRVYAVIKGVRTGMSAITNLPNAIRRNKGKGKKRRR